MVVSNHLGSVEPWPIAVRLLRPGGRPPVGPGGCVDHRRRCSIWYPLHDSRSDDDSPSKYPSLGLCHFPPRSSVTESWRCRAARARWLVQGPSLSRHCARCAHLTYTTSLLLSWVVLTFLFIATSSSMISSVFLWLAVHVLIVLHASLGRVELLCRLAGETGPWWAGCDLMVIITVLALDTCRRATTGSQSLFCAGTV